MLSMPETIDFLAIGLPRDYGKEIMKRNPQYFNIPETSSMPLTYQRGLRLTQLSYLIQNDFTMPIAKRNQLASYAREKSREQYALWANEVIRK